MLSRQRREEPEYTSIEEVYDKESVAEDLLTEVEAAEEIAPIAAVLRPLFQSLRSEDCDTLVREVLSLAESQPLGVSITLRLALGYAHYGIQDDSAFVNGLLTDIDELEAKDDSFEPYYFRGAVLKTFKRQDKEAVANFLRALSKNPSHAASAYNVANCYASLGERLPFSRAVEYLQQLEDATEDQFQKRTGRIEKRVAKVIGEDSLRDEELTTYDFERLFWDNFAAETPSLERSLDTDLDYILNGGNILIAKDGEKLKGFSSSSGPILHVNGKYPGETGYIQGSVVAVAYRRQGVRTELFNQQEADLKAVGCKELIADTQPSNIPSLSNLCGKGFNIVCYGVWGESLSHFTLRKPLVDEDETDFSSATAFDISGKSDEEIEKIVLDFYRVGELDEDLEIMGRVEDEKLLLVK